MESVTLTDS